jgi:LCP family protein required for cell wall assembly
VRQKDKPYRVYRGGRIRGPIRPLREPTDDASASRLPPQPTAPQDGAGPPVPPVLPPPEAPGGPPSPEPRRREPVRRRRGRRVALWLALVALGVLLLAVAWGAFGYVSFRGGVKQANERLTGEDRAALAHADGSLLTTPTTILLLGIDSGAARGNDRGRSDAIVLVHTDPDHHRLSLLSIPRDLRIDIPNQGFAKINSAYAMGGIPLAAREVEELTGVQVNHVVVVDFGSFPDVIDAIGGVTVDIPRAILSNRFDCPYGSQAECDRWKGWRFAKGEHTLDGRRALVYSRIRENQLDPKENDLTRGSRQQQVVQALADKLVSFDGFVHLPFWGKKVTQPLATDLSATQLLELGWVKFRASTTLRCRLGGEPATIDGVFYLIASEDNAATVDMALGRSAPQPPRPADGLYGPGCTVR